MLNIMLGSIGRYPIGIAATGTIHRDVDFVKDLKVIDRTPRLSSEYYGLPIILLTPA